MVCHLPVVVVFAQHQAHHMDICEQLPKHLLEFCLIARQQFLSLFQMAAVVKMGFLV
jgi:hypothetical protein